MPSDAVRTSASVTSGGLLKSMSATHIGMRSSMPSTFSYLISSGVFLLTMLSKSYIRSLLSSEDRVAALPDNDRYGGYDRSERFDHKVMHRVDKTDIQITA